MLCRTLIGLTAALAVGGVSASALAEGTAFTYQGQLKQFGTAVNTATDMQFSLWTAPTGGSQVGSTLTTLAVSVANGLFATPIDFGVNPYTDPQNLYLQIAVRNPSGTGPYVTMGSRQLLTPAPFSLATRGVKVDDLGRVSLNATGPGSQNDTSFIVNAINPGMLSSFNVSNGGFATRLETLIDATTAGNPGGARIRMQSPNVGYGPLTLNDAMTIEAGPNGGYVGIGTTNPNVALDLVSNQNVGMFEVTNTVAQASSGFFGVNGSYTAHRDTSTNRQWDVYANGDSYALVRSQIGPTASFMVKWDTNNVMIGTDTPSAFKLDVNGTVRCTSLTETSSRDLKEDIAPLSGGLDTIMKLKPISYSWNDSAPEQVRGAHDIGFLADEMNEVLPDIVAKDANGKPVGINYGKITPVAVEAIKQLKNENDQLRARLEKIEAILAAQAGNAAR